MDIEAALIEEAQRLAANAQRRVSALETELKEIERQKTEVAAKCQTARLAPKRALQFQPSDGAEFYCPRCWVERGKRSTVRSFATGKANFDCVRCNDRDCNAEIVFRFRD